MSSPPLITPQPTPEPVGCSDPRSIKPVIKILLYTDDLDINVGDGQFGLATMIAHIKAHEPAFAKFDIDLICRNSDKSTHADNKLEKELIKDYDEIWVFGFHQGNKKRFTLGVLRGGDQSELDETEVQALEDWMRVEGNGGGLLMTGDHSEERAPDSIPGENSRCPDTSTNKYLGLGRAIGRCVPRAGRLRRWEGSPTNIRTDSFNTQVAVPGTDIDGLELQLDPIPQQLILRHFNEEGVPAPNGWPHPLFFYNGGRYIRAFPDHAHEGAIVLPNNSEYQDKKKWPEGRFVQPRPQVVAHGVDERHCRLLALVAAYDGDLAGVGRIVADSTWHHYFNINLTNFSSPAQQGSAADQIGQYYANLAVWLSPLSKRQKMAHAMTRWVISDPQLLEEVGNDVPTIGRAAYSILARLASPCEMHELLQAVAPGDYREQFQAMYFPERGFTPSSFPSKEFILGGIVERYQREMIRIESSDNPIERLEVEDVIDKGFRQAFNVQAALLMRVATAAQRFVSPE